MTKSLCVYYPFPIFSKTCTFLYFYILSHLLIHLLIFFFFFFSFFFHSPQPHFHRPYPQSKTFLDMQAVPSSTIFCSNAVLITTPRSSMQFFSFFYVLRSAPYYHWNDLNDFNFPHSFDFSL